MSNYDWERADTLADAVCMALRRDEGIIHRPQSLLGACADVYDAECRTPEMQALERYCDEQLLEPFAAVVDDPNATRNGEVAAGTALEVAAIRAADGLCSRGESEETAQSVALGIAQGIGQFLGMSVRNPWEYTTKTVSPPEQPQQPPAPPRVFEVCASCGRELERGGRFCSYCGPGTWVERRDELGNVLGRRYAEGPVQAPQPSQPPQTASSSKMPIVLAVVGAAVVSVLLVVFVMTRPSGSSSSTSANMLTESGVGSQKTNTQSSTTTSSDDAQGNTTSTQSEAASPQSGVAKEAATINSVGTMNGQISTWTEDSSATALVVTNKSDTTLHLEAVFTYTPSSGTGSDVVDYDYVQALAPGASTVLVGECPSSASSARYSITGAPSIDQDPPRYSIYGDYDLQEVSRDADGVEVSITNKSGVTIGVRTITVLGMDKEGNTYVATSWIDPSENPQTMLLSPGDSVSVSITSENMYGKDVEQSSLAPNWNNLQLEYCVEGYTE